jgi:hypothetical protein
MMSFPMIAVRTICDLLHEYSPIPESTEFRGANRIQTFVNHCHVT